MGVHMTVHFIHLDRYWSTLYPNEYEQQCESDGKEWEEPKIADVLDLA